ncbi:MAG: hypothetical protein SGPRY_003334, partial [Prymnesium sp.]
SYMLLDITPYLVPTADMVADIFSKSIDRSRFPMFGAYMFNASRGHGTQLSGVLRRAWREFRRVSV